MGVDTFSMALSGHSSAFLDTMIFSYHLGGHARYAPLTTRLLQMVESGELRGLTTTVTLAELLTRPAQEGNQEALRDYEAYLLQFPHLDIVPLDTAATREAALVRAATGLRMPDAVQIATARLHAADVVVTNDHRWAGKLGEPAVILLDDFIETS